MSYALEIYGYWRYQEVLRKTEKEQKQFNTIKVKNIQYLGYVPGG